ncbi:MAG: hypothetical protein HYT37_01950 [Candidatus Sungbacteria bacterium]|nr:hypothetical protein [Candidatus Sungbacteria bacterium]
MNRKKSWGKYILFLLFLLAAGGIFIFWGFSIRGILMKGISPLFRLSVYLGGYDAGSEEKERIRRVYEVRAEEYEKEIESLHRLLDMKARIKTKSQVAGILWYGKEFGREFLVADKGKDAGIEIGDIAADAEGFIIGTIREAGENFSKISVASNAGEVYEINFLPAEGKALARGFGARTFGIELIPSDFTVRRGDFILLRETGGHLFFLGEVVREEPSGGAALKQARAVLLADPSSVSHVLIVKVKPPL